MASAGSLIFELAADVSHLRTDMAKAQGEISSALDSISKSTAATALLTGAEYAQEFAKGFAEHIQSAIDTGDAFSKLAVKVGSTTEELSALAYAGKLSDVTVDDLNTSLRALSKSMVDAKDPASTTSKALQAIGLSAKDLKGLDPAQAFEKIAEAMSHFKDGADKTAVAMALMGKNGANMLPMMADGAKGLEDMKKEAADLGAVIDGPTAQAMADMNDDLTRMQVAADGVWMKLARDLSPAITELTRLMKDSAKEGNTMSDTLDTVATAAKGAIVTLLGVGAVIGSLAAVAGGLAKLAGTLTTPGGMNEGLKDFADGWHKGQAIMDDFDKSATRILGKMSDEEKAARAAAAAAKAHAAAVAEANKQNLKYDPSTKIAAQKKEVDDYAKMMDDLNKKMTAMATNGDPMAEMMADPKFQKLAKDKQESLIETMNDYLDLKGAMDLAKQAQADDDKAKQQAADTNANYMKSLQDAADAQLDAIDPLRVHEREMAQYNDMLQYTFINQNQFNDLVAASGKKFGDALQHITPMTEQTKALTEAIDGFGKESADAFVNFATGADTLGNSFRQLIADMLKEMAKMIAYQYVFKSIFDSVSNNAGSWISSAGKIISSWGAPSGGVSTSSAMPSLSTSAAVLGLAAPTANASSGGSTGGTGGSSTGSNVVVNVHMNKDKQDQEDTTADSRNAAELGKRISAVVRQVITTEKRTGGLLANT